MSQACASWHGDVGAYVMGTLDKRERAEARLHLASCPACRADYEDLLPVRDWLAWTRPHLTACPACRDHADLPGSRLAR